MDAPRSTAIRSGMRCLLPGLLLVMIVANAGAATRPPPPPPPANPPGAIDAPGTRTVVLIVALAADGSVTGVELETSSGFPTLDAAAVEAAAGWHFNPLQVDGKPVAGRARIPVKFPAE